MPKRRRGRPRKRFKGAKLSVMVLHRVKDTMELTSSIKSYKGKLAAAFEKKYAPRLESGETLPDYELALELLARDVKAALGHLIELDDEADDAVVELRSLRLERESVLDELYPRILAVRGAIDLAFGRARGRLLHGLRGRTQRKPQGLEAQVRRTLGRLEDPSLVWPAPKNPHASVDRQGWIRQLKPGLVTMSKLGRQIGLGAKAHEGLVVFRRRAIRAFDLAYGDALRQVKADFKAAGFDARALKNLKPYYQRRRLSKKARKARETRAAAAAEAAAASATATGDEAGEPELPGDENARVTISRTVAQWLEKSQLYGT